MCQRDSVLFETWGENPQLEDFVLARETFQCLRSD